MTPNKKESPISDYSLSKIMNDTPGWYRGDFHVHSNCSDGVYPVETVTRIAETEGLDFHAITDHNTIESYKSLEDDRKTLVIPGIEVTFRHGHFNVFGLRGWEDWMEGIVEIFPSKLDDGDDREVAALLERLAADGHIISINHPCMPPWAWKFGSADLRHVTCLEIMCDLYWPGSATANPEAIKMWISWLNAGHRITGIGGSDYHYPPRPEQGLPGERLGMPTTYVYARELSTDGIIEGLEQGRAYVTKGPKMTFHASLGGKDYMIGDDLGVQEGEIEFFATVTKNPSGSRVQLIKCGEVISEGGLDGKNTGIKFADEINPSASVWYSLAVTDKDGEISAITNPIYVGPPRKPKLNLYSDF
jgi:hypothetical protein